MVGLRAENVPEAAVRTRARTGCAAVFPPDGGYGTTVFGAAVRSGADLIDSARLVPPMFTPRRLERLIDLAREPTHQDVVLDTVVGGFRSPLPVYLSPFGSTRVATGDLGLAASRQAGWLAFELKVGQGAKPGLSGMTMLDRAAAARVADQYTLDLAFGAEGGRVLRCGSPGTFTAEILRQQIRLMRNNFPRAPVGEAASGA